MSKDMWFKDDVQRILDMARQGGADRSPDFHAAIDLIATGFGLEQEGPPYEVLPAPERFAVWLEKE